MKRKIARLLVLSTLILSFYGCASGKADQTYPSYFEPVIQELTPRWTDYREGHPTSGLMDAFCDRGVSNGGRYCTGCKDSNSRVEWRRCLWVKNGLWV